MSCLRDGVGQGKKVAFTLAAREKMAIFAGGRRLFTPLTDGRHLHTCSFLCEPLHLLWLLLHHALAVEAGLRGRTLPRDGVAT